MKESTLKKILKTSNRIFVLLAAVFLASCSSQESSKADSVEYQIYNAVIDHIFANTPEGPRTLVAGIEDQTNAGYTPGEPHVPDAIKTTLPLSYEIIKDYEAKNANSIPLRDLFRISKPHVLLDSKKLNASFDTNPKGFWESFHQEYPGAGIIRLSQIAFNPDSSQALVYIGHVCGQGCGQGYFAMLGIKGGEWKVQALKLTWTATGF